MHPLPNLLAVNVVIHGLLGRGVADSTSLDPQAKGLGEQLRARVVELPVAARGRPRGAAHDRRPVPRRRGARRSSRR